MQSAIVWTALCIAIGLPILGVAASPLLAWRDPIYIIAGFAGVVAMALLLVQPTLVAGYLPGISKLRGRRVHRWTGSGLVLVVTIHVVALWITSPPDVIDALLFVSPTSFAYWGVVAMWAIFAAAFLAAIRQWLRLRPIIWRRAHSALVSVAIVGSVVHAILIEGTMEPISKLAICLLVVVTAAKSMVDLKVWRRRSLLR